MRGGLYEKGGPRLDSKANARLSKIELSLSSILKHAKFYYRIL